MDGKDFFQRIDQDFVCFPQITAVCAEVSLFSALPAGDGQQISVSIPSGKRVVGIAVPHPPIGKQIQPHFGGFFSAGDAHPDGIDGFEPFNCGRVIRIEHDCRDEFHDSRLSRRNNCIVGNRLILGVVGKSLFFDQADPLGKIVFKAFGEPFRKERPDRDAGIPLPDIQIQPFAYGGAACVDQPFKPAGVKCLEIVDYENHVINPEKAAVIADEVLRKRAGRVGQHVFQRTGVDQMIDRSGELRAMVGVLGILAFAVEQNDIVRRALAVVGVILRMRIPAVAGIDQQIFSAVEKQERTGIGVGVIPGKGRVLKSLRMLRRSFGRFPWSGKSEFLFFDFCPLCVCDSSILFRSPAENSAMRKKLFSRISP